MILWSPSLIWVANSEIWESENESERKRQSEAEGASEKKKEMG